MAGPTGLVLLLDPIPSQTDGDGQTKVLTKSLAGNVCVDHVVPPLEVPIRPVPPTLNDTSASHLLVDGQTIDWIPEMLGGRVCCAHVLPPFVVPSITAELPWGAPSVPDASHTVLDAQTTPESTTGVGEIRLCVAHVDPPLVVPSITVPVELLSADTSQTDAVAHARTWPEKTPWRGATPVIPAGSV
jgi:hypothetical protein